MRFLLLVFCTFVSFHLSANLTKGEELIPFDTPEKSHRYYTLIEQIRCPVCQGQSIGGSNAELAQDLRQQVAKMLNNNKTDQEIKAFMVARYGDFVSFKPPVNRQTYALWFAPFAFLLLILWLFFAKLKANKNTPSKTIDTSESDQYL